MLDLNSIFDESYYLTLYPEVGQAVSQGFFSSGLQHFTQFGQFERRNPSAFFDASFYLQNHSDVAVAVNQGLITPFGHFIQFGQFEQRNSSAFFDNRFYQEYYQDVGQAVAKGQISPLEHFLRYGQFEQRDPISEFYTSDYLTNNPDVAAAINTSANTKDSLTAIKHFVRYGQFENRDPGPDFNPRFYLQNNPDVAATVGIGSLSAFKHYIQYGLKEGRLGLPEAEETDISDIRSFGILNGTRSISGFTGNGAPVDLFSFTLDKDSNFRLVLDGLSADADVVLYPNDGSVQDLDFYASAESGTTPEELVIEDLSAGNYIIEVEKYEDANTNYNLTVSATPVTPKPDTVGNSLNNTRDLGNLNQSQDFSETIGGDDVADYYSFTVTSQTNLNLSLNSEGNNDAKLELLDSNGNSIQNVEETDDGANISTKLTPGNYSIAVKDSNGDSTSYNLGVDVAQDTGSSNLGAVTISNRIFDGREGSSGTFKMVLNQAPESNVIVTFSRGDFLTVDADGIIQNGTQSSVVFTPQDWNQPKQVWFIAEKDDSSENRNQVKINFSLSGGQTGNYSYDLGTITNTYVPDPSRYNIDLDFRNDYLNFWTPERRQIAQQVVNGWESRIKDTFSTRKLTGQTINQYNPKQNALQGSFNFEVNRVIDDLVIFVSAYDVDDNAGGWGGPQIGGSDNEPLPRAGMFTARNSDISSENLRSLLYHEIGHVLGLLGSTEKGNSLNDTSSPQTAAFIGEAAKVANGNVIVALQSQDGPNPVTGTYSYGHPSDKVKSIMSYAWVYKLSEPTQIDYAMLADLGYKISGVNA